MVNCVYIIILIELVKHLFHISNVFLAGKLYVCRGNLCKVGSVNLVAKRDDCITNGIKILCCGVDGVLSLVTLDVLGTCLKSILHDLVLIDLLVLVNDGDNTLLLEEVAYATVLTKVSTVLRECSTNVTCGTVTVVGLCLNDDCNARGAVALVHDLFEVDIGVIGKLLNSTLNVIVGHVVCLSLCDKIAKLRVVVGVGTACLNSNSHFLTDLGKDLGLGSVCLLLLMLNIIPLRMS